jgi:hypothetical protein
MESDPGKTSNGDGRGVKLPAPDAGITAFIVRVLNQLSLSAWLPAALFTAGIAVLSRFRTNMSLDIGQAVADIATDPLALLVILVPLLVVMTMITQAFSFGAIRLLEGYGRPRDLLFPVRTVLIRWHVWRKGSLKERRLRANSRAFAIARERMLKRGIPHSVVDLLEAETLNVKKPPASEDDRRIASQMNWRWHSETWRIASIASIIEEEKLYPAQHRILPTRLGNVLRSFEDQLDEVGGDVGGFVVRNKHLLPERLREDHDHHRARLDMYAMLVIIGLILAVISPLILAGPIEDWAAITVVSGVFVLLSLTSYHAAITSAAAYGGILLELNRLIKAAATGTKTSATEGASAIEGPTDRAAS